MKKIGLFCIELVLLIQFVYATDYYADISITADDTGFVTIEGNTNYPGLIVKDDGAYTSKQGNYWILNITTRDIFSDYVYSLELPDSASVNYIKSSGSFRIENSLGNLLIKGYGENKTFSVIVQYEIQKKQSSNLFFDLLILAVILTLAVVILTYLIIKNNNKTKEIKKENVEKRYNNINLSSRQKRIVQLLSESGKPMTQAKIQSELKIPKASISRNIRSLELKGLIEKEDAGMSNLIRLKK